MKPKNFINYHLIRALSSDGASEPIRDVYTMLKELKMISAQHSSNNGKNWQKVSYQKIIVVNTVTLSFSILTKFDIKLLENAWGFHHGVT